MTANGRGRKGEITHWITGDAHLNIVTNNAHDQTSKFLFFPLDGMNLDNMLDLNASRLYQNIFLTMLVLFFYLTHINT